MPSLTGNGVRARFATPDVRRAGPGRHETLNRPVIFQTARMGSLGIAPPRKTGDGSLFPALIVAIGETGRRVVEQFKRTIVDRYASAEKVPNVRILCIDTDPSRWANA